MATAIIIIIAFSIFMITMTSFSSGELRLLQSVFRHGDRYPLSYSVTKFMYPSNPHANVSWFPNSDGGLTIEGKQRAYKLGSALRERYGQWLNGYSNREVDFVYPDGVERSIMTLSLVAAGLFPPDDTRQKWNPSLNWQPVAIKSIRFPENVIFYGGFLCSKYMEMLEQTKFNDSVIAEYDASMKEIYEHVSSKIGGPVNNRILYYLYMEFLSTISGGLSPPEWVDDSFLNQIFRQAAIMEFQFSSWTDDLKRMTGGLWIKRWLEHVDEYVQSRKNSMTESTTGLSSKKKAFFYSGHDVNVAGIMSALGVFYRHVPDYGSAINFELHEDDKQQFYVQVVHRDSDDFIEYVIPECGHVFCPLDTFRNIFSNLLTFDMKEHCGSYRLK